MLKISLKKDALSKANSKLKPRKKVGNLKRFPSTIENMLHTEDHTNTRKNKHRFYNFYLPVLLFRGRPYNK